MTFARWEDECNEPDHPNLSLSIAREHPSFCMRMYYAAPRLPCVWGAYETPTALIMIHDLKTSVIVRN